MGLLQPPPAVTPADPLCRASSALRRGHYRHRDDPNGCPARLSASEEPTAAERDHASRELCGAADSIESWNGFQGRALPGHLHGIMSTRSGSAAWPRCPGSCQSSVRRLPDVSAAAGAPAGDQQQHPLRHSMEASHVADYLESLSGWLSYGALDAEEWRDTAVLCSAPRRNPLLCCSTTGTHHRGQLVVYLRLLDVPVPSVYGPTADENCSSRRTDVMAHDPALAQRIRDLLQEPDIEERKMFRWSGVP